jgi:excisionase family DNA binding protein
MGSAFVGLLPFRDVRLASPQGGHANVQLGDMKDQSDRVEVGEPVRLPGTDLRFGHQKAEVLTATEVASILRSGLSTVYEMFERGDLPGFRLGKGRGTIRFLARGVSEFIENNMNCRVGEPHRASQGDVAGATGVPEPAASEPIRQVPARPAVGSRVLV